MGRLDVRSYGTDETVAIALDGELDMSTMAVLEQELQRAERKEPSTLVLDLRRLTFLDSTGLRMLIETDQRARRDGRHLMVVRGPELVDRVFAVTLLDRRLDIVDEPPA